MAADLRDHHVLRGADMVAWIACRGASMINLFHSGSFPRKDRTIIVWDQTTNRGNLSEALAILLSCKLGEENG
jgi:hypothetical protein